MAGQDSSVWKTAKPYVNGGFSGMMSTVIIQPIDMVKVRLQLGEAGGPVRWVIMCRADNALQTSC